MSGFLQRADHVSIRSDDLLHYIDTPENFALDFGDALPAMPVGVTERFYVPGKRHALNAGGDTIAGGPMPWPFGDAVIEALPALILAQTARVAPSPPAPTLAEIKAALQATVDAQAEARRLLYITAGAGQAMTYNEKGDEAKRLAAAIAADPAYVPVNADYPLLAASLGVEGETLQAIADLVSATRAQWLQVAAAIEGARLAAKKAISEAGNEADARDAALVTWPA